MSHKKLSYNEFCIVGVMTMALLTFFRKKEDQGLFPLDRLKKAKQGDMEERNSLISEYKPFILRVTSEMVGYYIIPGDSDEFSIALQAFDEGINSFDEEKGLDFIKFSEKIIKWRLTDYQRKMKKFKIRETSFEREFREGDAPEDTNIGLAVEEKAFEQLDLRSQILELQKTLSEFGISFSNLASGAPKHLDSRQLMISAAKTLSENKDLMALMHEKKDLPVAKLVELTGLNRKTFYRNREYIIALSIILSSDMDDIKSHIEFMAKEETKT